MRFAVFLAAAVMACSVALMTGAHASVEKRVALVIGNGAYVHAPPLPNPANDATLMAETFRGLGFQVIEGTDVGKTEFDAKIREFARLLTTADTAVFYYAGHGLQVAGQNYLLPIDAKLGDERDLAFETVRSDIVLQQMELERSDKTNIVFLDACRDNPLARNLASSMGTRSAALGRGLAQIDSGVGTFVAFSTQPGNVALDGTGRNSPFTEALARHVGTPGHTLPSVMVEVRKSVLKATSGKQVPWDHSALTGNFYFVPPANTVAASPSPPSSATELAALKERMQQLEAQLAARGSDRATPSPAAAPAASTQPAPADCIVVGRTLEDAVEVRAGMQFCSQQGREVARILEVRPYGVVYLTEGRKRTTCKPGQLCSFDWTGAPLFTTRVTDNAGNLSAALVPSGR